MDNRNLSYSSNGVIKVCIKHHVLMVLLRVIKVCIKHHVLMVVLRVITLLLITFKLLLVYTLQILLRGNNIIILPVLEFLRECGLTSRAAMFLTWSGLNSVNTYIEPYRTQPQRTSQNILEPHSTIQNIIELHRTI